MAPATAQLLARAAQGLADDLLTALLLARTGPVLLAPAMNDEMYAAPQTRANLATPAGARLDVRRPGGRARSPRDRRERPGRMSEPEAILAHAARVLLPRQARSPAARVVVTAGPTREPHRSGAGGHQPLERQDGLPAGGSGLGARRRGGARHRAGERCNRPVGVRVRRVETHRRSWGRPSARSCPARTC